MSDIEHSVAGLEDPDPFTIIFGAIGVVSLAIQLHDKYKSRSSRPHDSVQDSQRYEHLTQLQTHARGTLNALDDAIGTVEHGSSDVETELYSARIRVGEGAIYIRPEYYQAYIRALSSFYTQIANLSTWINHIIFHNSSLAEALGERLDNSLAGMPDRINALLSDAGPNREALAAARQTLLAVQEAVGDLLSKRN